MTSPFKSCSIDSQEQKNLYNAIYQAREQIISSWVESVSRLRFYESSITFYLNEHVYDGTLDYYPYSPSRLEDKLEFSIPLNCSQPFPDEELEHSLPVYLALKTIYTGNKDKFSKKSVRMLRPFSGDTIELENLTVI